MAIVIKNITPKYPETAMAESALKNILDHEANRIKESFKGDPVFALIEIIRSLDYQSFMLGHNVRPTDSALLNKYLYNSPQNSGSRLNYIFV